MQERNKILLIIPLAGRGSRFANVGFITPKPLIKICGKSMLYYAFQSVKDVPYEKVIFIALKEHEQTYGLSKLIKEEIVADFELILLDEVTAGQLCTVLTAAQYFQPNQSLLIASSDSYIVSGIADELKSTEKDGLISVINFPGEQWSFARTDEYGRVVEVAEKTRISDYASTGIYYFKDAQRFEQLALEQIQQKETTKGEYYIMPLYNKLISEDAQIELSHASSMWDMGTPEAKKEFENYINPQ